MFVTSRTPIGRELIEACPAAGVDVTTPAGRLTVDGVVLDIDVIERSHPHPGELAALVESRETVEPGLVVADRISAAGRDVLRAAGWSWLDRRGHLRVWRPGLRLETDVALGGSDGRGTRSSPWTAVGLEVALHALCHPDDAVRARAVAAEIGRSVGGTQEVIGRFAEHGLIGRTSRRPLLPDLFWETAAHWPDDDWTGLAASDLELGERVGAEAAVRVDARAATLGGARIAGAGDQPQRFYLRTDAALRRARALVDRDSPTRCFVRRAPVDWLPLNAQHPADPAHPWSVAHPMLCAVRLAADPSRGREIVEDWGIVPGEDTE